jgi:hypothetical protein
MNIKTAICLPDLLRGTRAFPEGFFDLVREPILQGSGLNIGYPPEHKKSEGLLPGFQLEHFRRLALNDVNDPENSWVTSFFFLPEVATSYLKKFLPGDCFIFSFEMPPWLSNLCIDLNIPFIDFRPSPLRFSRDLYIALRTNDATIHQRISEYSPIAEELKLEASHLAASINMHQQRLNESNRYLFSLDNCIVFVGQAPYDASLINDQGKSLRCSDFSIQLRNLCANRKLIYKPHPFAPWFAEQECAMLTSITSQVIDICNQSAYQILSTEDDVQLVGISSGLLQEAQWFGKTSHTLYQPFVKLSHDGTTDLSNYVQIHFNKWMSPGFWHQILTPESPLPKLIELPNISHHFARHTLNQWWDYDKVISWERALPIEVFNRSGGNVLRKRIEELEIQTYGSTAKINTNIIINNNLLNVDFHDFFKEPKSVAIPTEMILGNRADIVVKYMYAARKINAISYVDINAAQELYKKHIIIRTGGKEPHDELRKSTIEDFLRLFNELIFSMINNGYLAGNEVPISLQNNLPIGGAHRIATSLALRKNFPVLYHDIPGYTWDINWFHESGFRQKEINLILRSIFHLKPKNFLISILWSPVESEWENIEADLALNMPIIYARIINFDRDSFNEMIFDIYSYENGLTHPENIQRKIELLKKYPSRVRVIFSESSNEVIHSNIKILKKEIREKYEKISPVKSFVTLHIGGSELETLHLLNIFANENTLLFLSKRKGINFKFLNLLNEFADALNQYDVLLSECCIVGGAVLNALGIREADDIDFTVIENLRFSKFDKGVTKFSSKVDLVSFNYPRTFSLNKPLTDDELISNPDFHFYIRGIRFAHPKIILERKQYQHRDKDLRDLKAIAKYLDTNNLSLPNE